MTTPRIEAMMTGSDIFSVQSVVSNFFSQQVAIDNLISQLKGANKTTSVFGDDTWTSLFSFDNAHVCASTFDIRDLDSCDNLIYRYLPEAIKSSDSLLIAHFLSIDHIGHSTSSLDMKQISLRLDMISQFLSNLIDTMGHNSVLIVTGDHGMRPDGNHGGNSVD